MVSAENIKFTYSDQNIVFDNLNISISAGGIYGLLGKNGAGKTTLLKLLCGVIFPDSGSINFLGHSSHNRAKAFLQEVFLVGEDTKQSKLSGTDYLKAYADLYPRFDFDMFNIMIKEWGINPTKKLTNLSSGENKKFVLSFALASNCRLLLLDEPTNGLDIPSKAIFRNLIASNSSEDRSIVISSHQVRDLEDLIDPIIILDQGQILLNQSIAEIENKISFSVSSAMPDPAVTLYSEAGVNGFSQATIRHKHESYTKVDLEILFNAAITNPQIIKRLWSEK